ncbi:hypothetical protein [uncultured Tenacibaculum sp.]|uniref:hypothetical protein n=1 Tax=uncultured Tenacibaculum sp. TaxID=174713 RepID=UPI002613C886|nr:hypothetical protein [uncultured Tenacibaculum sp.]
MKTFKSFVIILCLGVLTTFTAQANENANPILKAKKLLRSEISSIIGSSAPFQTDKTVTANVSFMLNSKGEIVVLDVESKSKDLRYFIKRKLNYKKINSSDIRKGNVYELPITVKKG